MSSSQDSPRSSGSAAGPSPDPAPRIFRSTSARVLGWTLLTVTALNYVDLAVRGRNHAAAVAAAALLLGGGVAYVLCLRPRIEARATELLIRNPFRDVRAPWGAVTKVDVTDAIRVHAGQRSYRSWTLQETSRARVRARLRQPLEGVPESVAAQVAGRTHTEYIARQLDEMAAERRRAAGAAGPVRVVWSKIAVAAVVVPLAILVAVLLVP